jgi:hypothetical protein
MSSSGPDSWTLVQVCPVSPDESRNRKTEARREATPRKTRYSSAQADAVLRLYINRRVRHAGLCAGATAIRYADVATQSHNIRRQSADKIRRSGKIVRYDWPLAQDAESGDI